MSENPPWKTYDYRVMIREFHLDTFGHVNNARYFDIFEEARWDLITQNNYGLKRVQELKIGPVILECTTQFKRELKLRETITVRTSVLDYVGKIMRMEQVMLKSGSDGVEVEACRALFVVGLMDLSLRKLIPPTLDWWIGVGGLPEYFQQTSPPACR